MAADNGKVHEQAPYVCSKWIIDDNRTWWQIQATELLKKGPIPHHVALILDGNRTFARSSKLRLIDGHRRGLSMFSNALNWCDKFGVREITGYIFSIENFKRSKPQVNGLMRLAQEAFIGLLNETNKLREIGMRVRVVGDWSMVPAGLVSILAKIMLLTKDNTTTTLNLAFAYTGRNEITRAAIKLEQGVERNELDIDDLNVSLMDEVMKISSVQTPPDLLIRTSGVTRLSDFLIWQSTFTILHFVDVLWPELTFWDIWRAIFQYQVQCFRMEKHHFAPRDIEKHHAGEITNRGATFLKGLEDKLWQDIITQADKLRCTFDNSIPVAHLNLKSH